MSDLKYRPLEPGEGLKTQDGYEQTEITNTYDVDGKWFVLPSLWMVDGKPKVLSPKEQFQAMDYYLKKTGKKPRVFDNFLDAESFTKARTKKGGVHSGPLFE